MRTFNINFSLTLTNCNWTYTTRQILGDGFFQRYDYYSQLVPSTWWKMAFLVYEIGISDLKLVQPVHKAWKMEYFEAIHIHKHKHENLLNGDDGNIISPILKLFDVRRKIDERIIDLTADLSNDEGVSEIYFDCEW